MCYHYKLTAKAQQIESRFHAQFEDDFDEQDIYAIGFSHPKMPIITNTEPTKIKLFHWGLIPFWVKDANQASEMSNMCLNAKIETVNEKPSFRDSAKHKRCIIPATSFYEWKWLDAKGKHKEKYEIKIAGEDIFAFGGLWSDWTNKETGEIMETFSIVTTEATGLMAEIHNSKKRMPVILLPEQANDWLTHATDPFHFSEISQHQNYEAEITS